MRGLGTCAPRAWNGTRSRPCTRPTASAAARCTASCATSAAPGSCSSSRSSSGSPRPTDDGTVPWTSWRDRPLYVQEGDRVTGRSVTAEQYGRFLIDVFEEWVRRDVGEVYVQMFDVALANWVGEPPGPVRALARRAGSRSRSSTPATSTRATTSSSRATSSGTSASSTCSSSSPRSSSASSGSTSATRSRATASNATCASPATAAARRTASSRRRTASPGLNYLCAGFKAFFHHVDGPMRIDGRAARRRTARRPRSWRCTRAEDAKRGRNDPCTCGSGRKWKHCHGAPRPRTERMSAPRDSSQITPTG